MKDDILPSVIFSPGTLALDMTAEMAKEGAEVTLFTPGKTTTVLPNITADMSYFDDELRGRGDTYLDLLKKHTFTFITLARQVQAEIIAKAYEMANDGKFDIVHIYTNEEDMALIFARFCKVPVVFTHHDPYNFFVKYKSLFPQYKHLNYISMSHAQQKGMPEGTKWAGNVYHGIHVEDWQPNYSSDSDYVAYMGRIVPEKGVEHAIAAVRQYNKTAVKPLKLKLAGKHYAGHVKDTYWQKTIEPLLGDDVEYVGHISNHEKKNEFLAGAKALLVPSVFAEPFGMVTIESLACGTPVIGSHSGAIPELIKDDVTGFVTEADGIADAIAKIDTIDRHACRQDAEERFTIERMATEHLAIYQELINKL